MSYSLTSVTSVTRVTLVSDLKGLRVAAIPHTSATHGPDKVFGKKNGFQIFSEPILQTLNFAHPAILLIYRNKWSGKAENNFLC